MGYIKGAHGLLRWDEESNENVHENFGMCATAKGIDCVVVESVKYGTLR